MSVAQLPLPTVDVAHCEVCGSAEVQLDEVQSGGRLLLVECGRCDHRFTARLGSSRVRQASWPLAGSEAEIATAA